MRIAPTIELTTQERTALRRLVNGRRTEVRVVQRAQIVLAAARGMENRHIAEELDVTRETVGRWRSRFAVVWMASPRTFHAQDVAQGRDQR